MMHDRTHPPSAGGQSQDGVRTDPGVVVSTELLNFARVPMSMQESVDGKKL
jgi:hypothetical protein